MVIGSMINLLSEKLIQNAHNLKSIGVFELAWKYDYILNVINILYDNKYIILGGDVYKIDEINEQILSVGDSWYYNKAFGEDDIIYSYRKAIEYISKYHNRNGDNYYYSVLCETYLTNSNSRL
jgi:hypothetical protein